MELKVNVVQFVFVILILVFLVGLVIMFYRVYMKRLLHQQNEKHKLRVMHQQQLTVVSLQTSENEARRIGALVHDALGNKLNILSLWLKNRQSFDDSNHFDKMEEMLESAISESRTISHQLFPSKIEFGGLIEVVQDLLEAVKPEINTEFYSTGEYLRHELDAEVQLYRVMQEFVNNSIKHSEATLLSIAIRFDAQTTSLVLCDNGVGYDANTVKKGLGQKSIDMRIESLQGKYKFKSKPGEGTRLILVVPNG